MLIARWYSGGKINFVFRFSFGIESISPSYSQVSKEKGKLANYGKISSQLGVYKKGSATSDVAHLAHTSGKANLPLGASFVERHVCNHIGSKILNPNYPKYNLNTTRPPRPHPLLGRGHVTN